MKSLLILFFFPLTIFSQSYQVKYEYQIPSGTKIHYELTTNGNYSEFINIKSEKSKEESVLISSSKERFFVLKNIEDNVLISTDFLGKKRIIIKDSLNIIDWELIDEHKEVIGMKCLKAKMNFRGRDYIAYYSPEINVQDGPWKFQGLPGLIMEIYTTDGDYHYQVIEVRKIPDFKEKEINFQNEKLYDWKSFKELYVTYIDNLIKYFKSEKEETGYSDYYKVNKPEIIYEKAQTGDGIEF
ncbi:hypothetical protein BWZ20_03430 [Winogradskyella sp. J14-2]|uniref:GLPGLI family protein n=1 Tax=Winogradskyella sp. J14-2 TaxID=1936080 RepID=UPI000972C20E|nr:GLPGLI family protein [Winogradskyella sp. J14-2]APY07408.1 hypothetical protein BWZ20_03430 [Winogradskyella sp. J14-2]